MKVDKYRVIDLMEEALTLAINHAGTATDERAAEVRRDYFSLLARALRTERPAEIEHAIGAMLFALGFLLVPMPNKDLLPYFKQAARVAAANRAFITAMIEMSAPSKEKPASD